MNIKSAFLITAFFTFVLSSVSAQYLMTRAGQVKFNSETPLESIEAVNNSVAARIFIADGKGQFIIPIKSFRFKNALMQEHFNENYMESDKYTRATYDFTIDNWSAVNLSMPGQYKVNTSGKLKIKNTTKSVEIPGTITVKDAKTCLVEAHFTIAPADYGIEIPSLVADKIAKSVTVVVDSKLTKK